MSSPDLEMEAARGELQAIVDDFNKRYDSWGWDHFYGANFSFVYEEGGRKKLSISDLSKIPEPPRDTEIQLASVTLRDALLSMDGSSERT